MSEEMVGGAFYMACFVVDGFFGRDQSGPYVANPAMELPMCRDVG